MSIVILEGEKKKAPEEIEKHLAVILPQASALHVCMKLRLVNPPTENT